MRKIFFAAAMAAMLPATALAQQEEETENGVMSLAGKEGFTLST